MEFPILLHEVADPYFSNQPKVPVRMRDAPKKENLSRAEAAAAARVLEALKGLDPEQAERVLAHVHDQVVPDDSPMFARGIAGPLGKLDFPLRTKVDDATASLFLRHCRQLALDVSMVLRDCVYALVYGKTYRQMVVERVNHDAQRTEALAQLIGPFGSPEFGGPAR